jgi:hypothetical protein
MRSVLVTSMSSGRCQCADPKIIGTASPLPADDISLPLRSTSPVADYQIFIRGISGANRRARESGRIAHMIPRARHGGHKARAARTKSCTGFLRALDRMPVENAAQRPAANEHECRLSGAIVDRMARIYRPAVEANLRTKPAQLDEPLRGVVAGLAQTHKRAEPKFIDVASVRLNMITDLRRPNNASLQAILAKRMREQLVPPDPRPAPRAIPSVPLRSLAANTHYSAPSSDALDTNRHSNRCSIACPPW